MKWGRGESGTSSPSLLIKKMKISGTGRGPDGSKLGPGAPLSYGLPFFNRNISGKNALKKCVKNSY